MAIAWLADVFGPGVYKRVPDPDRHRGGRFLRLTMWLAKVQMTENARNCRGAAFPFVGLAAVFIALNADIMLTLCSKCRQQAMGCADIAERSHRRGSRQAQS